MGYEQKQVSDDYNVTMKTMRKLSSHNLAWPTNWTELFGRTGPLIVEIGFGYATYLVNLAQQKPEANVVGLEIANECLNRAESAITRLRLTNLRVVHSTAETALHHLFEQQSIQEIHINFPDPWFKRSHEHRRLMKRRTLDAMVSRLAPGGRLFLATDILEYAEMCAALFEETAGLTTLADSFQHGKNGTAWVNEVPGRFKTKYEGKARAAGRACYYFAYERNTIAVANVPVIKDWEMPHIVFKSPLSLDEMLTQFAPIHRAMDEETHISLLYGYRGESVLLFEAYVREPTIEQRVALILVKRQEPQEYTIQLGMMGHPRPTEGIHKAVGIVGEWLLGLHPENRVIEAKVKG